jgi:FixJ family two-component response regulator
MAKRKNEQPDGESIRSGALAREPGAAVRVLVVATARVAREMLAARLGSVNIPFQTAHTCGDALATLDRETFEVVLIHDRLSDGDGFDLAARLAADRPEVGTIVLTDRPTLDDAMKAMRSGATDLLVADATGAELAARIGSAAERCARVRQREARIRKLRRVCRQINEAREDVSAQLGAMCEDLASVYSELNGRAQLGALAGEFNGIIRQELDIESLLRTALEFILAKTGPTNAAVFLPASSGDFSLGAYVNYDCAKDTAEVLLDHLASALAPRFENETGVTVLSGRDELTRRLGECADWIGDSNVIVFPCRHDGECLAVVALFRGSRQAFTKDVIMMLGPIADLFGRQLGRVIKIHHRHLPKHQWGAGDPEDLDLSA